MHIGSVEIHLLSDGLMWLDGGGTFGLVPLARWEKLLPPDEFNRVPLSLNCLLIRSEGKTILVDTGLSDCLTNKQRQSKVRSLKRLRKFYQEKIPPGSHVLVRDNLALELGANIFFGDEPHTFFGQFENNTNVYTAVRYTF